MCMRSGAYCLVSSSELLDGVNSLDVSLQLLFGGVAWQTIRPIVTIVFGCPARSNRTDYDSNSCA